MIALYNATGGDNWSDNDNWLSDRPLNEWHGITTNIVGRVTEINLRANRLHGHIPPELSLLPRLERLDLSINGLIRDLPGELARLTNLTYLDISSNDLTGQIPYEIGRLRGLNFVDLSLNRLTGEIPHSLASSSTITRLNLSYNQLTGGIPTDFAHGSKLQELRLTKNQLTSEIPAEIERLQSLEELYLNDNQLSGEIPPGIGQLSQLDRLDLSNNQLSGVIPTEMSELTRLFILNVDNNQLTGSVPFALAKLERLWMLSIADNNFTGCIPKELRRVSTNNIEYANVIVCGEPPRTETITPPYIEWTISDEVTPSQELAARLGVQWLADYLELIGWPTPDHKIAFFLGDYDAVAQAWADRIIGCDIQCAKDTLNFANGGAKRYACNQRQANTYYYRYANLHANKHQNRPNANAEARLAFESPCSASMAMLCPSMKHWISIRLPSGCGFSSRTSMSASASRSQSRVLSGSSLDIA